jgi:hypothetical protein
VASDHMRTQQGFVFTIGIVAITTLFMGKRTDMVHCICSVSLSCCGCCRRLHGSDMVYLSGGDISGDLCGLRGGLLFTGMLHRGCLSVSWSDATDCDIGACCR